MSAPRHNAARVPRAETHRAASVVVAGTGSERLRIVRGLRRAGYAVRQVDSSAEARQVVSEHPPDLLLLALQSARREEMALLTPRAQGKTAGRRPILCVADSAATAARALAGGADACLVTPVPPPLLRATVKALVGASRAPGNGKAEGPRAEDDARLLEVVQEVTDSALFYLDRELRFIYLNPAAERMLGKSREEMAGRTSVEVFPEQEEVGEAIARACRTGEEVRLRECHYPCTPSPAQSCQSLDITIRAVPGPATSCEGLVVSAVDVTERVAQRERLVAEQRARAEQAEGLSDEIAHRVRNNLAMLSGLLHMQLLSQPSPEVAVALRAAIGRMRTFVTIHELARATCADEVDLVDALRRVAVGAQQVVEGAAEVELVVRGGPRPCAACLATNLCVAANELITNALRHAAPGRDGTSRVEVEVTEAEGALHLVVRNTGVPVPADFDPSRQTGMGLRLVWGLVVGQYQGQFSLRPWEGGSVAEAVVPG